MRTSFCFFFALIVCSLAAGCSQIQTASTATKTSPSPSTNLQTASEERLVLGAVPVYPGAENVGQDDNAVRLISRDESDKVFNFYHSELSKGGWKIDEAKSLRASGGSKVIIASTEANDLMIKISRQSNETSIELTRFPKGGVDGFLPQE